VGANTASGVPAIERLTENKKNEIRENINIELRIF